jgi:multidrug efflux pump subunit AcrA (membrane-fusion protein)
MELMQIDKSPYLHRVRASEARVESTRVDFESSRQHHDRQTELFDIGSLSTVQLEESSYALVRAESAHKLAKAELELARYDLDKTTTRAPFDGWVIDKRAFVGQSLSTSHIVPVSYVVAPAGEYIVMISPPPDTAMLATVGTLVEIEINGEIFAGKITFPRASGGTEPGQVTASFTADDKLILPGTRATVRISR